MPQLRFAFALRVASWTVSIAVLSATTAMAEPYNPPVAAASDAAEKAIGSFKLAEGFKAELVAAEPALVNPVAFCFDDHGRIFVCETFRFNKGAEDNRGHMNWLDDDLAAKTVEDRRAYLKKHLGEKLSDYTKEHDRLRLLEDRDGDGRFESSTVFADGFNDVLSGIGAGVLTRGGDVFYTCIPDLWRLRDTNGDGQADERTSLHHGFGVRFAFVGHDLHGLCWGPDGKLYFSTGDRGFNIVVGDRTFAMPDRGAVFRCYPDGSEFEVVHSGLRNPQELAFDKYGNLFTGDNNSDAGDAARWVNIVEGADTGWRMHYQYLGDRGPWSREKLWDPQFAGQAAYILPPIKHLPSGPSGLTYDPGVGLPDTFAGRFFLADFHGAPGGSGINAITVQPKGAGFEVTEIKPLIQNVLTTDVDFGPDGNLYISDWVEGWAGPGKGRIYRVLEPVKQGEPARAATKQLLISDLNGRTPEDLAKLLEHPDMRVRLFSQFALVDKGEPSLAIFEKIAASSPNQLARIHAIWGLGQLHRNLPQALTTVAPVLGDGDAEIRAHACKALGDNKQVDALTPLIERLQDDSPRVRFFAAQSLGKLGRGEAIAPLVELLRVNNDEDVYLRHVASLALSRCGDVNELVALATDSSPAVRKGIVLALRQKESAELARFLNDSDPLIVLEAARAIYDLQIVDALRKLAALTDRPALGEERDRDALWRRVLAANFRLGTLDNARAVAKFAARGDVANNLRLESLNCLLDWTKPNVRDRVLGFWQPIEPRDPQIAVTATREALPALLTSPGNLRATALQLAARLGIREVGPMLADLVKDANRPAAERVAAINALEQMRDGRLTATVDAALSDSNADLRAGAQSVLARLDPNKALTAFEKVLLEGTLAEKKSALAAIGKINSPQATKLLVAALDQLLADGLPQEVQLEVLESAAQNKDAYIKEQLAKYESNRRADDPLAHYREALSGGDAEHGRTLFFQKTEVYCVRCHKVNGVGGDVGPNLSKIGADKARDYLLQSIVAPNAAIAKGFESVMLSLDNGKVVSGVLREENDTHLRIVTAEGQPMTIEKSSIDDRATGKSAMPEDLLKKLTKSELRDLIEFLSTQTKETDGH